MTGILGTVFCLALFLLHIYFWTNSGGELYVSSSKSILTYSPIRDNFLKLRPVLYSGNTLSFLLSLRTFHFSALMMIFSNDLSLIWSLLFTLFLCCSSFCFVICSVFFLFFFVNGSPRLFSVQTSAFLHRS